MRSRRPLVALAGRRSPRRALVALLAVLALATTSCSHAGGSSAPTTTRPPAAVSLDGLLVFEGGTGVAERLYAVRLRSGVAQTLGRSGPAHDPRLSADGRFLASTRPRAGDLGPTDVYVSTLATGAERLVATGRCPTWSLDGTSLLVAGTKALQRVTVERRTVRSIPGTGARCGIEVGRDRYVLWDRSDRIDLLAGGQVRTLVTMDRCGLGPVTVDPSRRRIAFSATCTFGTGGLYVVDLAGGSAVNVLRGVAYGAAWSPDGTSIATAYRPSAAGDDQLWITTANGRHRRRIAGEVVGNPTWGPIPKR
ncbi:MAG: hypothetical protein JWM05_2592 [Acidimicrobiales bacterium]|nr:hypothetical protein [Acidimicrobiales bacterium]